MNPLKSNMVSTTSRDDLIGRRASMMITFCGLVLVLYATLYPFDFHFNELDSSLWQKSLIFGWGKSHIEDVTKNVSYLWGIMRRVKWITNIYKIIIIKKPGIKISLFQLISYTWNNGNPYFKFGYIMVKTEFKAGTYKTHHYQKE